MNAVAGSGSSSMSDSWICWKPRIDEPSNTRPSVKTSSSNDCDRHREVLHDAGQVTEPDVDELHVFLADELQDLVGTAKTSSLPERSWHWCGLPGRAADGRGKAATPSWPHREDGVRQERFGR